MSSINNDGKIQEPLKPAQDDLANELDAILNDTTTNLPANSVQSEFDAMMEQLADIKTFHPVREFNAGTPVAHTIESSVVEVNIQPEAKQGTVHETQGKKVQGEQVNLPTRPTLMHTKESKPLPATPREKKERAATKGLFDPEGKIGAVAKNTLSTQAVSPKQEQSAAPTQQHHVVAQKHDTTERKEKTSFSEKITNFMQKHFPKLSKVKNSTMKESAHSQSGKLHNFIEGLKARFSSTSRAAKVANGTDAPSIGRTTEKASKVGKMKLGNPIALIKGKLFAKAGEVKYTPIERHESYARSVEAQNLRDILNRFDSVNNKEIKLLEDNPELHTFANFAKGQRIEIELLLEGNNVVDSIKEDITTSALGDTLIGENLLKAKTADEMIKILATTATQIKEILDIPEFLI